MMGHKNNCFQEKTPSIVYIVVCQAHPALVKRSGVRTVFISLLVN